MKLHGASAPGRLNQTPAMRVRRVLVQTLVLVLILGPTGSGLASRTTGTEMRALSHIAVRSARTAHGDLSVLVHASSSHRLSAAVADVRRTGMTIGTIFRSIDVFVAHGDLDQLRAVSGLASIAHLEPNERLAYATDTSHRATNGQKLIKGKVKVGGRKITGAGVGVAVLDTGIDGSHPDLASNMGGNVKVACPTVVRPYDPDDPDDYGSCPGPVAVIPAPDTDTISASGHGTHVAGIVAGDGTASEGQFQGAAPDATLYGVSIGTALFVEQALSGLEWVLENHDKVSPPIKVVNGSWGGGAGDPDRISANRRLQDLLVKEGITMVFVAHNNEGDGSVSRTSDECINPTPGVICVANYSDENSGTRTGSVADTSSRGAADDPRTWPDISAPGTTIMSTCRLTLPVCWLGGEHGQPANSYSSMSGTSMAAPHVSGIVAQLLQVNPRLTPSQIEDIIEDTALKFSFGAPYRPDPANRNDRSSFDKGHGLIDALAAARRAAR